jgi:hypothetical protein
VLYCSNNLLKGFDVTGLTLLTNLECGYNNMANESAVKGFTGVWGGSFMFIPQRAPGFISAAAVADLPFAVGVGEPLTLTGKVIPAGATEKSIEWAIDDAGATGAALAGNVFTAAATGTATMAAVIKDGVAAGVGLYCYFAIHVTAAPIVTTIALPDGEVGIAYSETLAAAGEKPFTWALGGGSLPGGLSLSSGGVISGTPSAEGAFSFTVKATNGKGSYARELSITIEAAGGSDSGSSGGCLNTGAGMAGMLALALLAAWKRRK